MTSALTQTLRRRAPTSSLLRNGYALVLSVGLTSALGVTFWVVAAREYSVGDVGRGSALVSALITLSTLGQLNMTSGLLRFLPRAGRRSSRLVGRSYAASGVACVVLAGGFLAVAPHVSSGLDFLPSTPLAVLGFCAAVLIWSVFTLEDAALTGLRRAVWVPLENGIYGALKLALLWAFAELSPGVGVFAAWVLGAAILIPPVNIAIFKRWLPLHVRATRPEDEFLPPARQVGRYLALDYLGSACYLASTTGLPLLVVSQLGAEANGYFYVAWTVASCLDLVSNSLCQSLIVEASHSPSRLAEHLRSLLPRLAALLGLAVVVLGIGAPLLLRLYGPGYASAAGTVARLLVLGCLPRAVIVASIAVARVQRRVGRVLAIQSSAAVGVVGLTLVLAHPLGIAGIGLAWLLAQSALACVLLPGLVRQAWRRGPADAGPADADPVSGATAGTDPPPIPVVDGQLPSSPDGRPLRDAAP